LNECFVLNICFMNNFCELILVSSIWIIRQVIIESSEVSSSCDQRYLNEEGFCTNSVTFGKSIWRMILSKEISFTWQKISIRSSVNHQKMKEKKNGWSFITALTFVNLTYVSVFSSETAFTEQFLIFTNEFSFNEIQFCKNQ
jgi:hypothetical protein